MTLEAREANKTRTILCIPGLGGHRSAFNGYAEILSNYSFRYVEVIDWRNAIDELKSIIQEEQEVILLCSCYGVQLALRLIEAMPSNIRGLILIEPFFAEFHWWHQPARILNAGIVWFLKLTDRLGLRRKKFLYQIDYAKLAKYSVFFQPFFDIRWQNITDYFLKIDDFLTFKLPLKIETKTLFTLSPKGFLRNQKIKESLIDIFLNADIVEISEGGHNIITVSREAVSTSIREWLAKNDKP